MFKNIAKWKELVNKFVEDCAVVKENVGLKNLFIYDALRIEVWKYYKKFLKIFIKIKLFQLLNWCRDFRRSNDSAEFAKRSVPVQALLNSTMNIALKNNHIAFQRFGMEVNLFFFYLSLNHKHKNFLDMKKWNWIAKAIELTIFFCEIVRYWLFKFYFCSLRTRFPHFKHNFKLFSYR